MTSSEAYVRDYRFPEDYEQVSTLLQRAGMFSAERDSPERVAATAERPGSVLVVDVGGLAVGSVYVGNGDGIGIINGLVVDAAHRNNGYGGLLMRAAEAELEQRGYASTEILVDDHKDDLQGWYARQGYRKEFSCVGMVKSLTPEATDMASNVKAFSSVYDQCTFSLPGKAYVFTDSLMLQEVLVRSPVAALRDIRVRQEELMILPATASTLSGGGHNRWIKMPLQGDDYRLLQVIAHEDGVAEPEDNYIDDSGWYVCHDRTTDTLHVFHIEEEEVVIEADAAEPLYDLLHLQMRYDQLLKKYTPR